MYRGRLVAVDLDGIILDKNQKISCRTRNALLRLQEEGNVLAINTGRSYYECIKFANQLKLRDYAGYIICHNGSMIVDCLSNSKLVDARIKPNVVKDIVNICRDREASVCITYSPGKICILNDYVSEHLKKVAHTVGSKIINKKMIPEEGVHNITILGDGDGDIQYGYLKDLQLVEDSIVVERISNYETCILPKLYEPISKDYSTEVIINTNKGNSLKILAHNLCIGMEDVTVFGDDFSDIPAIQKAGTGIAVGNAIKEVKDLADIVVDSNEEDGVACYIEQNILGKE